MNIRHLLFFTTAVDCKGLTKAAERLRVSQPAVSAAIRALEAELGHQLFERAAGGRAVRPTEKGLVFYEHALDIQRRCDAALKTLSKEHTARLRMGILQTIPAQRVAATVRDLARHAGQWQWRFREGSVKQLLDWLKRGRIDIAWSIVKDNGPHARVLWREPYVALVACGHRLTRSPGAGVAAADLSGEGLILRGCCEMEPGVLEAAGLSLRVAAQAHRDELVLALVSRGMGIAIGPRGYASQHIVGISVSELTEIRSIGLRWRPEVPLEAINAVIRVNHRDEELQTR